VGVDVVHGRVLVHVLQDQFGDGQVNGGGFRGRQPAAVGLEEGTDAAVLGAALGGVEEAGEGDFLAAPAWSRTTTRALPDWRWGR
jgi:hypothetical protein